MICCVTGHRPAGFPFPYGYGPRYEHYRGLLGRKIEGLIRAGCTGFITGMALGADLDFAEEVLLAARRYAGKVPITLEAAIPCPDQTCRWFSDKQLARYRDILAACDKRTLVSPAYTPACMQKRNRYMVDRADIVLAVYNGATSGGTYNTLRYAGNLGKPVVYLRVDGL